MEIQEGEYRKTLDFKWAQRLEKVGKLEAFDYLSGDNKYREEQKELFLSDKINNPVLDYPKLNLENLDNRDQELLKLKKDILREEKHEVIKQAYRWRINATLAEVRMLKATLNGEMRKFKRYSEFVYGKPSKEIFMQNLQSIKELIDSQNNSDNVDIKQASEELKILVNFDLPQNEIYNLPNNNLIQIAKKMFEEEFADVINLIPENKKEFKAEEIKEIFQKSLNLLGAEGWEVVVDKNKTALGVVQETKRVEVPESRLLKNKEMVRLDIHEIGTHVKRSVEGGKSILKLLEIGFDRSEKGEEGVATVREQLFSSSLKDFAGMQGHLAIGLAEGLDGRPRNFRDVFKIFKTYFIIKKLIAGKELSIAKEEAEKAAWNRCLRTFKGTDCKTPGVCFTKDIVYREGNIGVWEVIKKDTQEMRRFSVGRYDPSNQRHLWILEQLGIGDNDLEQVENEK